MTLPRNYHSSEFSSDEAASVDEAPHFAAGGDSNMGRYSDEEEQVRADRRGGSEDPDTNHVEGPDLNIQIWTFSKWT